MKKISPFLALFGVVAAIAVYFLFFQKMEEQTAEVKADCVAMEEDIKVYKEWEQNKDYYVEETEAMTTEIAELVNEFPSYALPEDDIKLAYELDNRTNTNFVYIDNLGFADPQALYTADYSGIDLSESTGAVDTTIPYPIYVLYNATTSYGIESSYDGVKEMIRVIQSQAERKGIEAVELSMDSSTGMLSGSVVMNTYYLDGSEKPYAQPSLTPVIKGTENPFGTLDAPEVTAEGEEEASEEAAN